MVKRIGKIIAFFVIGIALFLLLQEILTPNWTNKSEEGVDAGTVLAGYRALEDDTVDVLFLGTSFMQRSVSPMKLYEDTKILSYNLGVSGQPIECSYYLLKQAFETQSPKVVFFEASRMYNELDSSWRYTIDTLPKGEALLELAAEYGKTTDNSMTAASAYLPIILYHNRWSELTEQDYLLTKSTMNYSMGQYIMSYNYAAAPSIEEVEWITKEVRKQEDSGIQYFVEDSEYREENLEGIGYDAPLSENAKIYFEKMCALCQENGAELVLVKMPSYLYPTSYSNQSWNREKAARLRNFAMAYGVELLDLVYEDVVDVESDFYDYGAHLNINGAEKVSRYIGKYLLERYDFPCEENPMYEEALETYRKIREVCQLQGEKNFEQFMQELIANKDKWTIFIAASDEYVSGLTSSDFRLFSRLGLQLLEKGEMRTAYVAILDGGKLVYETCSPEEINYSCELNGNKIKLKSAGWYDGSGSSIKINNKEYSPNNRGLNFVILDKETGVIIDCVSFDTFTEEKTAKSTYNLITNALWEYEKACVSDRKQA